MKKQKQLNLEQRKREQKLRRQAKREAFVTVPFTSREGEPVVVDFHVAQAAVLKAHAEAPKQMMLARFASEDYQRQAQTMGVRALVALRNGWVTEFGYLARCAFTLAENAMRILEVGSDYSPPGSAHRVWIEGQVAKTYARK